MEFAGIRSVPEGLSLPRLAEGRGEELGRERPTGSLSSLRAVLASTAWISRGSGRSPQRLSAASRWKARRAVGGPRSPQRTLSLLSAPCWQVRRGSFLQSRPTTPFFIAPLWIAFQVYGPSTPSNGEAPFLPFRARTLDAIERALSIGTSAARPDRVLQLPRFGVMRIQLEQIREKAKRLGGVAGLSKHLR